MDELLALLIGVLITAAVVWIWRRRLTFFGQRPEDYSYLHPEFDLRRHLAGDLICEGVIYGPTGRVTSRFVADVNADWTGETGLMREHFRYDSGTTQHREWRLTLKGSGGIRAEADDVLGAGRGEVTGNTVVLRYRIRLPDEAGAHILDVVDWMYLLENGTIVNRSQFRKFGIKVAELIATFRKKEA